MSSLVPILANKATSGAHGQGVGPSWFGADVLKLRQKLSP